MQDISEELLGEIRDLLREQNAHLLEIKKMNAQAAAQSSLMFSRSQEAQKNNEAMAGRFTRESYRYFVALLGFMLLLLVLTGGYLRSFWRLFGL